jgi:DNA polymerase
MSERDLRMEAASLARSLKRYVERQRGAGDLLAGSAAERRRVQQLSPGTVRESSPSAVSSSAPGPSMTAPASSAAVPDRDLFGAPLAARPSTRPVVEVVDDPIEPAPIQSAAPIDLAHRDEITAAALPLLTQIAGEARACTKCGLCETRTQAVPGVGSARSGIVFVGEAPGADEDRRGEPFVGRAGELLTKIIKAMDEARLVPGVTLDRETVFICNVLKCRPPENRNPLPHEIDMCSPYLRRQLEALEPRIICCLGKFAAELLVGAKGTIGGLRGRIYRYHGAKLIVTYHPAACLRNPAYKRPVWEDMQLLAREYQTD